MWGHRCWQTHDSQSWRSAAAHLAGAGYLWVQRVDEGSNTDGQRVFKNWQLDLKEHVCKINHKKNPSEIDSRQEGVFRAPRRYKNVRAQWWEASSVFLGLTQPIRRHDFHFSFHALWIKMLVKQFPHNSNRAEQFIWWIYSLYYYCISPYVLHVNTYIHLISYLSRGQGGEAVGVEELDQGARWDLGAYPEQQGEGCINQIQTCGLQAGGTAAQCLLWVWRVGAVSWQRL